MVSARTHPSPPLMKSAMSKFSTSVVRIAASVLYAASAADAVDPIDARSSAAAAMTERSIAAAPGAPFSRSHLSIGTRRVACVAHRPLGPHGPVEDGGKQVGGARLPVRAVAHALLVHDLGHGAGGAD